MANDETLNPFRVLKLPTTATNAEIVERGQELAVGVEQDEQIAIRQALEGLITHPLKRIEYELFEVPEARYEDQDVEKKLRIFKRNPQRPATQDVPAPELADVDLAAFIEQILDAVLTIPQHSLDEALYSPPFSFDLDMPLGVRDVIF